VLIIDSFLRKKEREISESTMYNFLVVVSIKKLNNSAKWGIMLCVRFHRKLVLSLQKKETRHLDSASGPMKFVKFVSFVIYFRNFTSHKTTFLANYIQHSAFHT